MECFRLMTPYEFGVGGGGINMLPVLVDTESICHDMKG